MPIPGHIHTKSSVRVICFLRFDNSPYLVTVAALDHDAYTVIALTAPDVRWGVRRFRLRLRPCPLWGFVVAPAGHAREIV